jgi:two-component system, cell cycle sensor histidine kinase and response regulator CckA
MRLDGLATVYGIVKQDNGFIEVDSVKRSGTTFRTYLRAAEGAEPALRQAPKFQPQKGTETILVAEDDDGVRETTRLILENLGYKVFAAGNGSEAIELFLQVKSSVDNGPEAAARMSLIKPHLAFIFVTGYGIDSKLRELSTIEKTAILQKPFDAWQLANKLREVLDREET